MPNTQFADRWYALDRNSMKLQIKYLRLVMVLILVCICSSSFSQTNKFIPEFSTALSSDVAPDILKQCSRSVPGNVESYFDLKDVDIQRLESDFRKVLSVNPDGCCYPGKIGNLKKYGYQYAGLVINNRRYIYINAFYLDSKEDLERFHKDWKTLPVIVCDGGESYWGALYDIENGSFSQLYMNGVS
ncbi:hypothetical protein D770_23450 [Flammeovirgaceae bacterium 311]|nr:hypothetical protein D770_23450 [Flammeovirgaceae bacterium 311]